jgi:methylphosphotriester-DNA--protein-cysteine methyltransferase
LQSSLADAKLVAPEPLMTVPSTPALPFDFYSAIPSPPLDRFVESIWAVRGTAPYRRSSVLPNGALQLMINFGAPHRVIAFGGRRAAREYGASWIAGLQDAPLAIESPAMTDLLSIRFRPGGAHAFLPLPLAELTNNVVVAADVLNSAAAELRERLALAATRSEQVQAAEQWLRTRCQPRERDYAVIARAVETLRSLTERGAPGSVGNACEQLGLSNKHLIHLFRSIVGLSPKTLARVQRFHAALHRLPAARSRAELALELGYADQAHFTNEFRRFAGVTPGTFVERRGEDDESVILG